MREQTCCFTGHREIRAEDRASLGAALSAELARLYRLGVRYFGAGGALGFDTAAAEAVLALRREHADVRLILILPCRDQTKYWRREDIARYEAILASADKVVYTAERYHPGCMHVRNRHLVEHAAYCVAYFSGAPGGTAYTVRYAEQAGLSVTNLYGVR